MLKGSKGGAPLIESAQRQWRAPNNNAVSDRTKSIRTAVPLLDAPDTGRPTAGRPGRHSPRAIQTGRPHSFDALLPVRPAPRDVLAQGVLYWDQIGSIVPSSFHLPDYLRQVADHGLYVTLEADASSRLRDSNPRPTHYETVAPRSTPTFRIPDHAQGVHRRPRPSVGLAAKLAANHSGPQQAVDVVGHLPAAFVG